MVLSKYTTAANEKMGGVSLTEIPADSGATTTSSPPSPSPLPSPTPLATPTPVPAEATFKPRLALEDIHKPFTPGQQTDGVSAWSTSSDRQLGDRVFPMRSLVSVDPTQTPNVHGTSSRPVRTSGEFGNGYFGREAPPGAAGIDIASPRSRRGLSTSEGDGKSKPRAPAINRTISDRRNSVDYKRPGDDRRLSAAAVARDNESSKYGGGSRMQLFSDVASDKSGKSGVDSQDPSYISSRANSATGRLNDLDNVEALVTARFKHVVTADGHAIITGRDGDTLQRCEDEPIHIPGAVQGFGLLIALEEVAEGNLIARVVSENSFRIIGYHPQEIFRLKNFNDILSEEQADNLLDHIDFIRDEEADPASNGPEVFILTLRSPGARRSIKLWCAMHVHPQYPDLIICEFELDDDQAHPLVPPSNETPEPPEDTLDSNPTPEEYDESTTTTSRPLRVLRSARKRRGEAAAMEVFNIMSQVQEQLAKAQTLDGFLKILVGVVKELTGFHRVMIYQFDHQFNGRVVTELVDPRATKDLYKGLNFPASDIPKQARDMYNSNKVRILYDRDLETARLVCRTTEDLERPLDLTFSYLRAISPIHIKYLTNMAVRSSMSISIYAFNELWGLVACHSYGSRGTRVSFPIRKMCRLVGDFASRNIERLSYASRLQARKLINTVPSDTNPSGYIVASSDDLLKLFDADYGLLSIRGETKMMGQAESSQEVLAMLEYLRLRKLTSVITSQDISVDFPDLKYEPGFDVVAGLLLVPLSVGGSDFIVFFRKGQTKEVKWAGNPYEKFVKAGTEGYLEPRKSFKTWSETVVGRCREWTEEQIETAAVLCLVYGKFIEVWRQKEAALQSSDLTRILLSNSAHEVRTPLNAIINYLEIALEGTLDQETRDNLTKSHSASKSLIYVINDLLDLTKTEEGQDLIKDEVFNLFSAIHDATEPFEGDAKRKGLDYQVIEHPGIPQWVHGDERRVRQAVANITANAMQNTTEGFVRVEVWTKEQFDNRAIIEIVIQDSGCGMSDERMDTLFRNLEQVTTDDSNPNIPIIEHGKPAQIKQGNKDGSLGLGLAMVSRTVRNMNGQLRVKSEEGKGSRFVMQLTFVMSVDDARAVKQSSMKSEYSVPATPPPSDPDGEVTLVERKTPLHKAGDLRRLSMDDAGSLNSFRTMSSNRSNNSGKSDVDRLIDAISGSHGADADNRDMQLHRSNSRESGHSRASANSLGRLPSMTERAAKERPGALKRSKSYGTVDLARDISQSMYEGPAGSHYVTDQKTLLTAVKMPEEFPEANEDISSPHPALAARTHKVNFEVPDNKPDRTTPKKQDPASKKQDSAPGKPNAENLQVLVAEDDPINSKIIKKRLERLGHKVYLTLNGEDCASAYEEKTAFFDVVLMDMQMPIVDGLTSTKMIRTHEKLHDHKDLLSLRASLNGRVPIFAVSASLLERERQTYIDAGFDGWILKPVDFKRLNTLLLGIVDSATRASCIYRRGEWEQGGWFHRRDSSPPKAVTAPQGESPVQLPPVDNMPQLDGESGMDSSFSTTSESATTEDGQATPRKDDSRQGTPTRAGSEARNVDVLPNGLWLVDGVSPEWEAEGKNNRRGGADEEILSPKQRAPRPDGSEGHDDAPPIASWLVNDVSPDSSPQVEAEGE